MAAVAPIPRANDSVAMIVTAGALNKNRKACLTFIDAPVLLRKYLPNCTRQQPPCGRSTGKPTGTTLRIVHSVGSHCVRYEIPKLSLLRRVLSLHFVALQCLAHERTSVI